VHPAPFESGWIKELQMFDRLAQDLMDRNRVGRSIEDSSGCDKESCLKAVDINLPEQRISVQGRDIFVPVRPIYGLKRRLNRDCIVDLR
jgi:hypothetical protein